MDRLWDAFVEMASGRVQSSAPTTITLFQQAEKVFLGPTDDLTLNPVVQDVFHAMRVAGLILLAFCTVISLAELAESSITGQGGSIVAWFKRFFVATLMTFGGLQVYGLWIRLFNGMLSVFRGYLDSHWGGSTDSFLAQVISLVAGGPLLLMLAFVVITMAVLFILWFMVGGVRQAELILNIVIGPVVWPLYLVQSVEDIPKTAFRGFLGLNAVLLFTVAMVRIAIRLAIDGFGFVSVWNLVPSLSMLVMTIFLPATIKRIVGQGQSGVGALVTAAQMVAGLKLLSLSGAKPAAKAAASPPASGGVAEAPSGPSAYPLASVPQSGMQGSSGFGAASEDHPKAVRAFLDGQEAARPAGLPEWVPTSELCMDIGESEPGSGQFDTLGAFRRFQAGAQTVRTLHQEDAMPPGGDP